MRFPEAQIEQVRDTADIVEVVSGHVPLKRQGQNHVGLCPFHQEKSPSFSVNPQKQIFHCFGCGVGGNVFTFLMKMEGLEFPEAVRKLADRYGVQVVAAAGEEAGPRQDEKERVRRINEQALGVYRKALARELSGGAGPVPAYLERRGLDAETVAHFELGWAPDAWDTASGALGRSGESAESLVLAGISVPRQGGQGVYDRFRARLMFPIRGGDGTLVGFGGRVLGDGNPKYLNSPETPLYRKSDILYGLYQARQAATGGLGRLAVVEGYLDVIACHRHGLPFAVAPLGTALTERHARLLARHTDRLDLVFDGDAAGRAAARKAVAVLVPFGMDARVVVMPQGEDPDSLLDREGAEAFRARLDSGQPLIDFLFAECLAGTGGAPVEVRLRKAQPALEVLALITDGVRASHYMGRLAELLGVDETALRRKIAGDRRRGMAGRPNEAAASVPVKEAELEPLPYGEALLLHLVMQGKVGADWLLDRLSPTMFSASSARRVATHIASCVRENLPLAQVVDRLVGEPQLQGVVADWMSREAPVEGDPQACAESCVSALVKREAREVSKRLLEDIRQAEARGDHERLMALLKQKHLLTRTA